jgi:hypothetical protein
MKNIRNIPGQNVQDPSIIQNLQYSDAAGSSKVSEVGRHLLPLSIPGSGTGYTTDASTARGLPSMGRCLAVYNNANAVGSVTLGEDNTITSLAVGATDSSGHVGIPCPANAWTYIACGSQNWVITSASTLLVFLVDDNSYIRQETSS